MRYGMSTTNVGGTTLGYLLHGKARCQTAHASTSPSRDYCMSCNSSQCLTDGIGPPRFPFPEHKHTTVTWKNQLKTHACKGFLHPSNVPLRQKWDIYLTSASFDAGRASCCFRNAVPVFVAASCKSVSSTML